MRRFGLVIALAAATLAGCKGDHHRRSPLTVSDYRLGAIERRVGRLGADDIEAEMLAVDAEAYDRPAGASFRDAVTRFYQATHPACIDWSGKHSEEERDSIHDARFMLGDFDALVGRLVLTPLRRDLDLA